MRGKALTAAAALALFAAAPATAGVEEVRFGVLAHDLGAFSTGKEDGLNLNVEAVFSSPSSLSWLGKPRPHVGLSAATDGAATSQLYAGLGWQANLSPRYYAGVGFGFMIHDGETRYRAGDPVLPDTAYLGCRVLARLSGEVGYRLTSRLSAALYTTHASNAGVCGQNEGLDATGFRLGYRF